MYRSPTHLQPARDIWLVVLVALALRAVWALWVPVVPQSDSVLYDEFARSIASGRGYAFPQGNLTAYWPVGTSAVYAGLYLVFGTSYTAIVLLNVVLGVLLAVLTYRLAALWFGSATALAAALAVACWPLLIQFTTVLASELLFTTLCMAALWLFYLKHPGAWRDFGTGVLLACACLVRPTAIALFPLFLIFLSLAERNWTTVLRCTLLFVLACVVVIGPWAWRNTQLFGTPVLVSANFGANLWMGNNPDSNGGYQELPQNRIFRDELERDRYFKAQAVEYIRADPTRYLRMSVKRFVDTHSRETIGVAWNRGGLERRVGEVGLHALKLISSAYWWGVAALAVGGIVVLLRRMGALGLLHPLAVLPAFFVAVPTLTVSQDRYHFPLIPLAAILAGLALASLFARRRTAGER